MTKIAGDYIVYRAGRLAWFYVTGKWPQKDVDHKNRVRTDDRWKNLRLATRSENLQNRVKTANQTSCFLGVTYNKQRKVWAAKVSFGRMKKALHIGVFSTEKAAARAYDTKVRELNLSWKSLNFGRGHRALPRQ